MVGKQIDIVREQQFQALLPVTHDARILAFPKIAMVYEQGIGTLVQRGFNQRKTRRHTADHILNLLTSLDLQTIGAIVAKTVNIQRVGKMFFQHIPVDFF